MLSTSAFSMFVVVSSPVKLGIFFNLPFLANVLVEVLLILCIPWKNNLQLSLNFPVSIPRTWAASLYSSQDTHSCFYCLHNSFLHFSLIRRPLLSDAGLLLSLSDFLHIGIESSFTLRKMPLKSWQLYSAPLFWRTVFQGDPSTHSLNKWKFVLKFSDLTVLFICPNTSWLWIPLRHDHRPAGQYTTNLYISN